MKLPENKKDRYQILGLIGFVVVVLIFAIIQFGISPFLASRQTMKATLAEQEEKIEKAKKEIIKASFLKDEYDNLTAEIEKIVAANARRPILGSYLVGVTETIEEAARDTGLTAEETQEVGVRELPRNKKASESQSFKSYAVQVNGEGSYPRITAFLQKLERDNPLLCITEIRISGRPERPEVHRVALRIEWPIEVPPEERRGPAPVERKPTDL